MWRSFLGAPMQSGSPPDCRQNRRDVIYVFDCDSGKKGRLR
jgi:hypothetical protein